jgi:hypothetical protein
MPTAITIACLALQSLHTVLGVAHPRAGAAVANLRASVVAIDLQGQSGVSMAHLVHDPILAVAGRVEQRGKRPTSGTRLEPWVEWRDPLVLVSRRVVAIQYLEAAWMVGLQAAL